MSDIADRIREFCKFLHIPVAEFERRIGSSSGYVNCIRRTVSVSKQESIARAFPVLNMDWLIMGVGEMLVPGAYGADALALGPDGGVASPESLESMRCQNAVLCKEIAMLREQLEDCKRQIAFLQELLLKR